MEFNANAARPLALGVAMIASLVIGNAAHATSLPITTTFDEFSGGATPVYNGYNGFNWANVYALNKAEARGSGYEEGRGYDNAVISGTRVGFNVYAQNATISSSGLPFTFNSGYFTAVWLDGLNVTVTGAVGGIDVYSKTFALNTSGPSLETFNWQSLSSVTFNSGGPGGNKQIAFDNLVFNSVIGAPEIDGAKLPLTMLLLGIGGIVAQRRRQQALA